MHTIQMTTYYDIHLHCPFCGAPSTHTENGVIELNGCKHLELLTASDFTIFMSDRTQDLVEKAGYQVIRENDDIEVTNPTDDDDDPNLISIVSKLPDAVIFEQIVGPPSLECNYTVFAYNDEDYANFSATL